MRPRKFVDGGYNQQQEHLMKTTKILINGPRPAPLRLKQESRTIRKPIIIYIRTPEVIHTKPHDFMALVQRLTGSKDQQQQSKKTQNNDQEGYDHHHHYHHHHYHHLKNNNGSADDTHDETIKKNPHVADVPLFTPSDYFCSPQSSFLKLSSPNMSTLMSPASLVEFMKELPEY